MADAVKANTIVVAVPSLALLKQSVEVWMREEVAREQISDWLCVCSDDTVGKVDDIADERADIGLPTTTSADEITDWLRKPGGRKIVFTTYQSSAELATAASFVGFEFDLIILDEAHRTAGARHRDFVSLLDAGKITARHRLFMTATEKRFRNGDVQTMLSMDESEQDYGARFYTMSFKEAIERDIITDYKIVTYFVTEQMVDELVRENHRLTLSGDQIAAVDARDVASVVVTKRVLEKYGVNHPLVFARSISASKVFRDQQDMFNDLNIGPRADNFHVDSTMSAEDRKQRLAAFIEKPRGVMSDARCLTEGVNVPGIDAVIFTAPKQSVVDIVQASGRAMRKAPGKEYGHIVIPIIVPDGMTYEEFAESTQYKKIVQIVSALSTVDDRIVEELRARFCGPTGGKSHDRIIKIGSEVPIGFKMDAEQFADAIETVVWKTVARGNWRPFEEARAFVRSLGLTSVKKWKDYCEKGEKPDDIPAWPNEVYIGRGWTGWIEWLGAGLRKSGWRPFAEAREFARSLGLKGKEEWQAYCNKSGQKPDDIPSNPNATYRNDWINYGDWLGLKRHRSGYRPFAMAREFARSLGLKNSKKWRAFTNSDAMPRDIPTNPNQVYGDQWVSWPDWLDYEPVRWRPFEEARAFVRSLGLTSVKKWNVYRLSERMPADIPSNPNTTYKNDGWLGWGDWLGPETRPRVVEVANELASLRISPSA
jgi:superfamily II DNA or RNA helicase